MIEHVDDASESESESDGGETDSDADSDEYTATTASSSSSSTLRHNDNNIYANVMEEPSNSLRGNPYFLYSWMMDLCQC